MTFDRRSTGRVPDDAELRADSTQYSEFVLAELRKIADGKSYFGDLYDIANMFVEDDVVEVCDSVQAFLAEPNLVPSADLVEALIITSTYLSEMEEGLALINRLLGSAEQMAFSLGLPDLQARAMLERADNLYEMEELPECVLLIRAALQLYKDANLPLEGQRAKLLVSPLTTLIDFELESGKSQGLLPLAQQLLGLTESHPDSCTNTFVAANAACMDAFVSLKKFDLVDRVWALATTQFALAEAPAVRAFGDLCTIYGDALLEQGRASEALPILRRGEELLRSSEGQRANELHEDAVLSLVDCLAALGKYSEAAELRQRWDLPDEGDEPELVAV